MIAEPTVDNQVRVTTFRFEAVAIRVSAPRTCSLLWTFLETYFSPYFEMAGPTGPVDIALDVAVVVGPLNSRIDIRECSEIAVDRSGGFLRCTGYRLDQGSMRWVLLNPFGVEVAIDRARHQAVVSGRNEADLRVPVLRIIEDATVVALEARGAVVLHASAVAAGDKAILLVGNKGAGKTTSLCRLLKLFNISKLANDNVVLWQQGSSVVVRGWPSFFKLAAATVATHEELAAVFPPELRDQLANGEELWKVYEKVALFPEEGAELFDRKIEPQGILSTIILPRFGKDLVPRMTAISRAELCTEIGLYVQGGQNPNHSDWMGLGSVEKDTLLATLIDMLNAPTALTALRIEWAPSLDDLLTDVPDLRLRRNALLASADATGRASKWPDLPKA